MTTTTRPEATINAIRIHTEGDSAGWSLDRSLVDAEDVALLAPEQWAEVLSAVDLAMAEHLTSTQFDAYRAACDAGSGPDADADIYGVRWIN